MRSTFQCLLAKRCNARIEEALGLQLLVCGDHNVAPYAEM
jgi:hypothetical protein